MLPTGEEVIGIAYKRIRCLNGIPTAIPTANYIAPTAIPLYSSTLTAIPTGKNSFARTANPTANHSSAPTAIPTANYITPTAKPTTNHSVLTAIPTINYSFAPTAIPTANYIAPTAKPTTN